MENKSIIKKIYKEHKKQLKYLKIKNKKLIICFSGIPCSGKTFIAKILEEKYKAVRINSDDIRKIIKNLGKKHKKLLDEKYKEEILDKYLTNLLENYPFRNKLIILDKGIDRKYKKIFELSKKHNFRLFVVSVKAPKRLLWQRAKAKPNWPDMNFINNIGRWEKEYNEFNKKIKADAIINNNKIPNLTKLFSKLNTIIVKDFEN